MERRFGEYAGASATTLYDPKTESKNKSLMSPFDPKRTLVLDGLRPQTRSEVSSQVRRKLVDTMKIINPFAKTPKGGGWLVFKHKNFVDDFGFKWIDRLEVRGTPSKSSVLNVFENGDIMLASTVLPYDGWLLFVAPPGSA